MSNNTFKRKRRNAISLKQLTQTVENGWEKPNQRIDLYYLACALDKDMDKYLKKNGWDLIDIETNKNDLNSQSESEVQTAVNVMLMQIDLVARYIEFIRNLKSANGDTTKINETIYCFQKVITEMLINLGLLKVDLTFTTMIIHKQYLLDRALSKMNISEKDKGKILCVYEKK